MLSSQARPFFRHGRVAPRRKARLYAQFSACVAPKCAWRGRQHIQFAVSPQSLFTYHAFIFILSSPPCPGHMGYEPYSTWYAQLYIMSYVKGVWATSLHNDGARIKLGTKRGRKCNATRRNPTFHQS